jgi:glutamate/tyrosine decarboxylase-like PLP-dependent enzyme
VDDQHPAAVALEHYSVDIVLRKFGLNPRTAHGHYTSGGTESNLTAMVVALGEKMRHQALDSQLYDKDLCRKEDGKTEPYAYERHGTVPLKAVPTVYVAPQTHVSIRKNARTLIGESAVRQVGMTRSLHMDPRALDRMISADKESGRLIPFMVVGTIGATESGIIDPLEEIGRVCRKHGVWLHIDAPWGGIAAFSPALRKVCMKGIEMADSITFDPHKTLVPLGSGGCGMFLTPHRASVARSFNVSGGKPKTYDYAYMSLQGSRALSGLRTMVQLADPEGLARRIESEAALGNRLRRKLRKAGWLITNLTPLPVICTIHPGLTKRGVTATQIVKSLAKKGIYAKAASLRLNEPDSVRLGIISRRTKDEDVDYVVSQLESLV